MQRMEATIQNLHREIREIEVDLRQSGLSSERREAIEQGATEVKTVAIEGIQQRPIVQGIELSDL